MTDAQRQALYDELMKGTPEDPVILHEFSEIVNHELDRIQPIIDGWLDAHRARVVAPAFELGGEVFFNFTGAGPNIIVDVIVDKGRWSVVLDRHVLKGLGLAAIRESGV